MRGKGGRRGEKDEDNEDGNKEGGEENTGGGRNTHLTCQNDRRSILRQGSGARGGGEAEIRRTLLPPLHRGLPASHRWLQDIS
eukprot:766309-Hanusia_phi.AAC.2